MNSKWWKRIAVIPVLLWALAGSLYVYNRWKDEVFREGYEHGAMQTGVYVVCHDWKELPPRAWRDEAWRYVNDWDSLRDCRLVKAIGSRLK